MTDESLDRGGVIKGVLRTIEARLKSLDLMASKPDGNLSLSHRNANEVPIPETYRDTFIAIIKADLEKRKEALEKEFTAL